MAKAANASGASGASGAFSVAGSAKKPALNGRAVLAQVKGGRVPPFWQAYRRRRRRDLARLAIAVASLVLLVLVSALVALAARRVDPQALQVLASPLPMSPFIQITPLGPMKSFNPSGTLLPLAPGALLVGAAALVPLSVALQACISLLLPRSQRPVLVLLPEGCVERSGALVRRVRVVSFADVSHIELRVSRLRTEASDRTARLPIIFTRASIRLILHDWTGRSRTWHLSNTFGQPSVLAQMILAAYREYVNTISARRPRIPPASAPMR